MKMKIFLAVFLFCGILLFSLSSMELISEYDLEDFDIFQPFKMIVIKNEIFIMDKGNYKIFKLSKGNKVVNFGKIGQGPKEYLTPISFYFDNHCIRVHDVGGQIVKFDLNGKWIESIKNEIIGNLDIKLRILNKDKYISQKMNFLKKGTLNISYYYKNKNLIITILNMNFSLLKPDVENNNALNSLYTKSFTIGHNHCFFIRNNTKFKIISFDMTKQEFQPWIEDKDYKLIKYSKIEKLKYQNEKRETLKKVPFPYRKVLKRLKLPEFKPPIMYLIADESDYLYVVTNKVNNNSENLARIYDSNAKYLKSIWIPKYEIIQVCCNKIYIIVEENDTYKLKIYKYN